MLKTLYASTTEIDDTQAALQDILSQIKLDELLPNTIGIVVCTAENVKSGLLRELKAGLPFSIVGCTSILNGIAGRSAENQFALMVLTADDVHFACGVSRTLDPAEGATEETIAALYHETTTKLEGKPVMGLSFAPLMLDVSADRQLRALDEASQSIPIFGTVALHYTDHMRTSFTIYEGEGYTDRTVLLLVSGNFEPHFFFAALSENRFLKQKAVITASKDNILMEVNDIPAKQFLDMLGITEEGPTGGLPSVPLSVDAGDGASPVTRAIFGSTPEGYLICGGDMPKNAALGVGFMDYSDICETTEEVMRKARDSGARNGLLVFSCLSRLMALGSDTHKEIDCVNALFGDGFPYLILYSAGELFPDIVGEKVFNKAHNDTLIACVF